MSFFLFSNFVYVIVTISISTVQKLGINVYIFLLYKYVDNL